MYPEELQRLIRQGEGQGVELKSSIPAPQDIAKHVAAFANTNGGTLILGAREPGEIIGVDEHRAREATEMAKPYLSPVPEMKVEALQIQGHAVVAVQVPASEELHSAMGCYFGRGALPTDAVRPLTSSEIRLRALKGRTEDAALSRLAKAIADQSRAAEKQTETIDRLNLGLAKANALGTKLAFAIAGAVAGAILMYFVDRF